MIRAPNHLGELVLALPALRAAARAWSTRPVVQVVERLAPVLELAGLDVEVLPLADRHRVLRAAAALRRRRPDVGVLLTPSFSAALVFALAGVRARRGTSTDGRRLLLTDAVDREPLLRGHRVFEYLRLVDPGDGASPGGRSDAGRPAEPTAPPRPRLRRLDRARSAWTALAGSEDALRRRDGPVVGLVPGANAPARRWSADRYRELARRLRGAGCAVRVFGAPGEESVTGRVAEAAPEVVDLGGRTDLVELAGGLASCDLVVGNDTGAAHLAAAAGRPLVVVWGSGDPRQTRPPGSGVRVVARSDLPCHPCVETRCPRRGPGYLADDARRECLGLVTVDRVEAAVREALESSAGSGAGEALGRETASRGRPQRGGRDG